VTCWPIWLAIAASGVALAAAFDRVALVGFATIFAGILAMQYPAGFPVVAAITCWSISAAIFISTGQSIAASAGAVLIAICYMLTMFGAPWSRVLVAADVAGLATLLALFVSAGISTAVAVFGVERFPAVSGDRGRPGFLHSGDLPDWPARAVAALAGGSPGQAIEKTE